MDKKCFDFEDYKEFLKSWIWAQPKRGRGIQGRLAAHLKIHSTMLSHILGGKQQFSEDQSLAVAEFLGLSEIETEYFIELVRLQRASSRKLQDRIRLRLESIHASGQEIKNRIASHKELSAEDSARFYSNWYYSAIRLLTDIPAFQNRSQLIEAFSLPRKTAQDALAFLLEKGLVIESEGKIKIGASRTHLGAESPHVWTLHKNWRLKAIEQHASATSKDLFYTAPMTIGESDAKKIREVLLQAIANATKVAAESKGAEKLFTLNMDWAEIPTKS